VNEQADSVRAPGALAWAAFVLIAVPALVRACVGYAPFPVWDADPFLVPAPVGELTPVAMLALDLAACLGAGLAIASAARVSRLAVALFALGAAGVLVHVAGSVEHADPGAHWIGALATGVGAWHLAQRTPMRRVMLACALGALGMLVAKGVVQITVEHPMTVAHFERTRADFFQSQGWEAGSRAAQIYERRLRQPSTTGWFGLANVYATFVAAGVVAFAGLGVGAWRGGKSLAAGVLGVGTLACAWALWMTGSKGAVAAAALGAGAAVVFAITPRRRGLDRALAWGVALVPIGVLGLVVVRGVVGERVGELSLLFRWFYLEGAARIVAGHPWVGVGPAGFKDAYLLARPAMSPEEVTSPHAAIADWVSTLGVFGVAWAGLLVAWARAAGRRADADERADAGLALGAEVRVVFVVAGVATAAAAWVERALATGETTAARVAGVAAWTALAWGMLVALRRGKARLVRAAAVGAAVVILAHTELDMTAVRAGSGALAFLILATLAAPDAGAAARARWRWVWGVVPIGVAGVLAALALGAMVRWERGVLEAATPAVRFGRERAALDRARSADEARRVIGEVAASWGVALPARLDAGSAGAVMEEAQGRATDAAIAGLRRAVEGRPLHHPTRVALGRLLLARGEATPGDPGLGIEARALAEGETALAPRSAGAWMWLGTVELALAERAPAEAGREGMERAAMKAWERGAALDPHGIDGAVRLMKLAEELGDRERAARWAGRALAADGAFRLDPLKQLSEGERREARRLVGGAGPGGSGGAETP